MSATWAVFSEKVAPAGFARKNPAFPADLCKWFASAHLSPFVIFSIWLTLLAGLNRDLIGHPL